jgi:hypothetical protein
MKHNQEMIVKHKEAGDWSKVRIIGLSIDQSQATLKSHVEAKGWGDVEHYWARNGVCNGDKDFGVRGVPHCCLVDTHGNIVWIGHPASRDLEKDINDLLAGKTLEGVKGGGDSDEEEEEEASATPVDFTKAAEAVESFKAASNGFLEETKKDAE